MKKQEESRKKSKSLVGYTWTNHWDYWFKFENGFLIFPEVIKNLRVHCLELSGRRTKVCITIQEITEASNEQEEDIKMTDKQSKDRVEEILKELIRKSRAMKDPIRFAYDWEVVLSQARTLLDKEYKERLMTEEDIDRIILNCATDYYENKFNADRFLYSVADCNIATAISKGQDLKFKEAK